MAKLKLLLAAALLAGILPAAASGLKVGYVDTQRIMREAPPALVSARRLEQDFKRREQELARLAAELQVRREALEKDGLTLAEGDLRAREREVGELARELQRRQREFDEDLKQRRSEENMALLDKANRAVAQIADSGQFDLIVQDAVWAGPGIDITERVIGELGAAK